MLSTSEYLIDLKPVFEGPLDLLLHLIRVNEIDIYDIPIAFILEEYQKYLRELEKLDIDISSEFLVMVSTLLEIKSRMLLPSSYLDNMESDDEWIASLSDPRRELVRTLIFHDIHRRLEDELRDREDTQLRIFTPGGRAFETELVSDVGYDLERISLFDLLTAFQQVLVSEKPEKIRIDMPTESLEDAMAEVSFMRQPGKKKLSFAELVGKRIYPARLIILFLAILELARLGMLEIVQSGKAGEIILRWK
jgi:segregation and condensation protein A